MRLHVGGAVPGRRQKLNPCTVSGYPMLGTFDGLGIVSCVKQLRPYVQRTGRGGHNHHAHAKRPLDKGNLCHRAHPERDYIQGQIRHWFEQARVASLHLDREGMTEAWIDANQKAFDQAVNELVLARARTILDELVRLEAARGAFPRTALTLRRIS